MTRKTLGRYPELSLERSEDHGRRFAERYGQGPGAGHERSSPLSAVMEDWFARDQKGKRGIGEKRRALSVDVLPKLGPVPIDAIARSDIRSILDAIVARGAPIQANRVLAYLRRLFNWAVERDIIAVSPAEKIKAPTAERSRDRTLSIAELAAIWNATASLGTPFDAYFQLLILTGQRRNEVAAAQWTEFDLEKGEWTIPASRAKNGTTHIVHLSPAAMEILTGSPKVLGKLLRFHDNRQESHFRILEDKGQARSDIRRDGLDDPRSAQDVRDDRHRRAGD